MATSARAHAGMAPTRPSHVAAFGVRDRAVPREAATTCNAQTAAAARHACCGLTATATRSQWQGHGDRWQAVHWQRTAGTPAERACVCNAHADADAPQDVHVAAPQLPSGRHAQMSMFSRDAMVSDTEPDAPQGMPSAVRRGCRVRVFGCVAPTFIACSIIQPDLSCATHSRGPLCARPNSSVATFDMHQRCAACGAPGRHSRAPHCPHPACKAIPTALWHCRRMHIAHSGSKRHSYQRRGRCSTRRAQRAARAAPPRAQHPVAAPGAAPLAPRQRRGVREA